MSQLQSCSLNRTWVLKMSIFIVVLFGFGFWALFDAAYLYPSRGLGYASLKLRDFLASAESAGLLRADKIAFPDPKAELASLNDKHEDLANTARREGADARAAAMDLARREYLLALDVVWRLSPTEKPIGDFTQNTPGLPPVAHALFFTPATGEGIDQSTEPGKPARRDTLDPQKLLAQLRAYWASTPPATALSRWDLPVQWFFVLVGFAGGGYLLMLLLRCRAAARRITFDSDAQRLTLATGQSMTPADLRDIDKRLWHKFYATLITESGQEHKVDLLRYVPLEDWVLQMERTRFPERAAEQDKPDDNANDAPAPEADADEPAKAE